MSAPSHYEINVCRRVSKQQSVITGQRYEFLFRTGDSLQSPYQASAALKEIKARFPSPEFEVSCMKWECLGHEVKDIKEN